MPRVIEAVCPKGTAAGISSRRRRRKSSSGSAAVKETLPELSGEKPDTDNKESAPERIDTSDRSAINESATMDSRTADLSTPSRTRQALALDTRLLLRHSEHDIVEERDAINRLYDQFTYDLNITGTAPSVISFTCAGETHATIAIETLREHKLIESLKIKTLCCSWKEEEDNHATSPPKLFSPKSSWRILRSLVDSIVETSNHDANSAVNQYAVTLMTRLSSLSSGDESEHVTGLTSFVEHLRKHFRDAKIQSVRVVLLHDDDATDMSLESLRLALEKRLQEMLEGTISLTDHSHDEHNNQNLAGLPVTVSIDTIPENETGYKQLVRQFARQALGDGLISAQMSIDLPEVAEDGMQCQLLLDASYHLLATSVDNRATWQKLSGDLRSLSSLGPLQVHQLIPYSFLDASLLFGIPIRLVASTKTQTWQDFQTMQLLFGSLLQILQDRDLALLLRVPTSSTAAAGGLLLGRPGQTLVLMARETKGVGTPPQTGLLFGYANDCQMLQDDEELPNSKAALDEDSSAELRRYIGSCIDEVPCGPYNPLVSSHDLLNGLTTADDDTFHDNDATMKLSDSHVA